MALMTPEQFEDSLKPLKPRIFMNGKQVENILENKIGLLVRKLVRKINRFGKRNIDRILNRKKLKKQLGVVLKKCFFDVLCGCRLGECKYC